MYTINEYKLKYFGWVYLFKNWTSSLLILVSLLQCITYKKGDLDKRWACLSFTAHGTRSRLRYLVWDCLCVYNVYRINNIKGKFFLCILCILKWLWWYGTPCNIHKDEIILKYDHNHFFKNIFPKTAFIKFYKGDKT